MFKLADFYARHNRRADADKVIEQLHAMETHPDSYGIAGWLCQSSRVAISSSVCAQRGAIRNRHFAG
jgi:hypothetical protein